MKSIEELRAEGWECKTCGSGTWALVHCPKCNHLFCSDCGEEPEGIRGDS